jgi:hypothetical protein
MISSQYINYKKGQALFFVFLLLLIVGILSGALASMWQAEIKIRSLDKEGLIAFYLAQAGTERAKIELRWDPVWDPDGGVFYNLPSLGSEWGYAVDVIPVAGQPGQRDILCRGGKRNDVTVPWNSTEELEIERRITVRIEGLDTPPPITGDDGEIGWSWREI